MSRDSGLSNGLIFRTVISVIREIEMAAAPMRQILFRARMTVQTTVVTEDNIVFVMPVINARIKGPSAVTAHRTRLIRCGRVLLHAGHTHVRALDRTLPDHSRMGSLLPAHKLS